VSVIDSGGYSASRKFDHDAMMMMNNRQSLTKSLVQSHLYEESFFLRE